MFIYFKITTFWWCLRPLMGCFRQCILCVYVQCTIQYNCVPLVNWELCVSKVVPYSITIVQHCKIGNTNGKFHHHMKAPPLVPTHRGLGSQIYNLCYYQGKRRSICVINFPKRNLVGEEGEKNPPFPNLITHLSHLSRWTSGRPDMIVAYMYSFIRLQKISTPHHRHLKKSV